MATIWQKTLFYLGLVDDDEAAEGAPDAKAPAATSPPPQAQAQVRTVDAAQPAQYQPQQRAPGVVAGRRVEPPSASRRRISSEPQHAEAGVIIRPGSEAQGRPLGAPLASGRGDESEIIVARTFSDAQLLADHIKASRPVVLDLRNAEAAMVRRLVDFASGLTYGLAGKMVKTAQGVILVTPAGVTIGIEERRRLAALDLYAPVSEG